MADYGKFRDCLDFKIFDYTVQHTHRVLTSGIVPDSNCSQDHNWLW